MRFALSLILVGSLAAVSVACGSATQSDSSSSDDALSSTTCTDKTLKCKTGYVETQDGCLQSHVEGAAPFAKCVKVDDSDDAAADAGPSDDDAAVDAGPSDDDASTDACVDETTLDCPDGYSITEDGCLQSHVFGAHPYARCEKDSDDDAGTDAGTDASADACVDIYTLECADGYEPSEDGCLQSHVEGADPYAHCVPSP